MAKISVTIDGAILQEIPINKTKITIGRRPTNDVILNHLTISGTHASIETKINDFFVEDLNSTNGTLVNGQPIKRHFLQNGDVISLARYKLKFEADTVNRPPVPATQLDIASGVSGEFAFVKVLNGSNAGKQLVFNKELTTLGTPDVQVATIARSNNTYLLTHVDGFKPTLVNDVAIGAQAYEMKHGDVIDLSGTKLVFNLV